jgi:gamma-glutamyl:cysteine ligase YbdK (ATP-grasp superfamily)
LYPILIPVTGDDDNLSMVREGGVPTLSELRLHQGTIWNWNRPVYDPADGGHLRIELRSLPSGPTPVDLMAGAAFHVGLTVGLSHQINELLPAFPFRYADYNFYRAAQRSLDAELLWPTTDTTSPREVTAAALCIEMLPVADSGLKEIGVDSDERQRLLGLIADRLESHRTPASWQRDFMKSVANVPRNEALRRLVEAYLDNAATRRPVTEW